LYTQALARMVPFGHCAGQGLLTQREFLFSGKAESLFMEGVTILQDSKIGREAKPRAPQG
jgi:hypothetical protein